MSEEAPLSQRILDAAEVVLRRHGADKANVVDVARVLGMSHANIYRHYPSKKAILDAVATRWLHAVSDPLEIIAQDTPRPAPERLAAWFNTLRLAKKHKVRDDPELFRVYHGIAMAARDVVGEHVDLLLGQIERIIADGIAAGDFAAGQDPAASARAFMQSTVQFHHPAMIVQDFVPSEEDAQRVLGLVLAGLRVGPV